MGHLRMRGCIQSIVLLKVQFVLPSPRIVCSWQIGIRGSLLESLGIVISTFIRQLFMGPGVLVGNGSQGI